MLSNRPTTTTEPGPRASVFWLACALAGMAAAPVPAQMSEVVLHNFGPPPKGAHPYAGVTRDAAGNFYGTTQTGGASDAGTVYKLDGKGHLTVIHSFTGGADGGQPLGGVILDSAGNLYGTTSQGGTGTVGVVYKLDMKGDLTVLHSFMGADGAVPYSGVIRDPAGNLYGTTYYGGAGLGAGVVYKLDSAGNLTVLYSFQGTYIAPNGMHPSAGVIRDAAGNLYGTTYCGGTGGAEGAGGLGVVYKLDTAGQLTVLHTFMGGADGSYPTAGVILDQAGILYGTTRYDGTSQSGVIYRLDTTGNYTVLYNFAGGAGGAGPSALIRDAAGNFYGNAGGGAADWGLVYKLDTAGQETVLYTFTGKYDGGSPTGVIRDSAGNLYGAAYYGGAAGTSGPPSNGVVFKLDPARHETVLYSFPGAPGGYQPDDSLTLDSAGNLYGTASAGGPANAGVVFKLDAAGHETVLYSFTGGADGDGPASGVMRDPGGNLYGTTRYGGTAGAGVVYKLDTTGHLTVLHTFTGGADGGTSFAGVVRDPAGNLYGTAVYGGTAGAGVVYKVDTAGDYAVLHSFAAGADGAFPCTGVILDDKGNLYGTTEGGGTADGGVVYKLDTTGNLTVLHSFPSYTNLQSGVIRDPAGNLFGTTALPGVVYKLDAAGNLTVLHRFTDGGEPLAGVILDRAGNLYGATAYNGTGFRGEVYKLDTARHLTVLYNFTGGADGANPDTGVIRDAAGNHYGTTFGGGKKNGGVVFKLKGAATAE